MALSLGVRKGFKWSIDRDILRVKEVVNAKTIIVTINNRTDYTITDLERIEILPDVFIQCGVVDGVFVEPGSSRLAIEAPRSIIIERVSREIHVPSFRVGTGGKVEPAGA